jgi:hypothetical protein
MSKNSEEADTEPISYKTVITLVLLMLLFVFIRFYKYEIWMQFSWDQIKNAWVMKDMIVDHKLPLLGMPAKLNSGIFIGPAYYYLMVPFFLLFNLNPIAGAVFAGFISIFTFIILFAITYRLYSPTTALISVIIYTLSWYNISSDRIAWPVIFIPLISLFIYYFSVKIIEGNYKNIIYLATAVGFAFHIHFTAIFFPIIILLFSWMFIFDKRAWKYVIFSVPFLGIWFVPQLVSWQNRTMLAAGQMMGYLRIYSHGFHLVRFVQLFHDAFIEFEPVLFFDYLKRLGPILFGVYLFLIIKNDQKYGKKIAYITSLWFIVPWLVFTFYSGELSNYYFDISRPLTIIIIGYIFSECLKYTHKPVIVVGLIILVFYSYFNISDFLRRGYDGYMKDKLEVYKSFQQQRKIEYKEGEAQSYLYYIYARNQSK